MRRSAGVLLAVLATTGTAHAAPFQLTPDLDVDKPGVAVSADGTGHVAWSKDVTGGGDQIVYCRLPRGATACASTQVFTPDDKESFGGVRVLAPPDGRVLLIYYRCCGGPFDGTNVIESTDGGATFGAPRNIGSIEPYQAILGPGDQTVSLTNHVVTYGIDYQAAPLAGGDPGHADLGTAVGEVSSTESQGTYGSTAFIDAQTPIVGMSNGTNVYVREWGGSGDYNDTSTWKPTQLVGPGDEPKLVSGPRGVHLMYQTPEGSYVVRPRLADGSFGPPSLTTPAGSLYEADFFQDDGGFLHLAFRENNSQALHYYWSRDGKTWSKLTMLADGQPGIFNTRVATAPDGGGFVVWDGNGGPITAAAIAPKGDATPSTGPPKNGDCRQTVQITPQVIAQAMTGELCFKGGKWSTDQPVRVNGLDFVPGASGRRAKAASSALLTIDSSDHTVKTNGYRTQAGPVVIEKGPVTWDVDKPKEFTNLDEFNVKILGFDVTGKAVLDVVGKGKAKIPVQVKLPKFFGGVTATATLSLDIANPLGLKLDKLSIKQGKGDEALFFGLVLTDLDLSYSGDGGPTVFQGTFTLSLPPAKAKAPAITATVKFVDGKFVRGGFPRIAFPTPLPLAPPFAYLSAVGFVAEAEPNLKLNGGAEFIGGPEVAGAKLVVVDALPPLSAGEGAGGLAITFGDPTSFDLNGKLKVAGLDVGSGGLHLDTDGLFTFYAGFHYDFFGVVEVAAGIPQFVKGTKMPGAFINFDNGTFGVTVEGSFCTVGDFVCGEGQGGLNSRAIYGCGKASVLGLDIPAEIGAAYEWGKSFDDGFHLGCDYGDVIAVRTLRQAGSASVSVPAGLPKVGFRITGSGGMPKVRVTGPGGVDLTTDSARAVGTGRTLATPYPTINSTFVEVGTPEAGTYTVTPVEGSAAIASVTQQQGLPDPAVNARVRRVKGRTYEVRYTITKADGDAVVFSERSDTANSELKTVKGNKGVFRFQATDGRAGTRSIVARVDHEGIPRRELVVASYAAPGPARPARPRKLRVRRSGTALKATWKAAAGADGYVVRVKLADGRSRLRLLGKGARRFAFKGAGGDKGTVSVSGITDRGREGPRATEGVKAKTRKKHRRRG